MMSLLLGNRFGSAVSDSYDVFASCVDNVIYMPIYPAMKNAMSNVAASNVNTTNDAKAALAHMWFNWYAAEIANVSSLSTANSYCSSVCQWLCIPDVSDQYCQDRKNFCLQL